ncbi:hypothetical protein E5Q_00088 [Mixia osmundae IAM 14324]|uniref:Ubiquitin-like protease family profile domain-containing protein n=1 Tax=Mixia osmundae (strain CBS 9802 / IAM 14324 / JCM 22182 / KY 12970) TaxID=764103 RepID=G7DS87_MIXOS|nr:hypothetical protein E5Q_00088 [Mixia osmundae IAM 14324]
MRTESGKRAAPSAVRSGPLALDHWESPDSRRLARKLDHPSSASSASSRLDKRPSHSLQRERASSARSYNQLRSQTRLSPPKSTARRASNPAPSQDRLLSKILGRLFWFGMQNDGIEEASLTDTRPQIAFRDAPIDLTMDDTDQETGHGRAAAHPYGLLTRLPPRRPSYGLSTITAHRSDFVVPITGSNSVTSYKKREPLFVHDARQRNANQMATAFERLKMHDSEVHDFATYRDRVQKVSEDFNAASPRPLSAASRRAHVTYDDKFESALLRAKSARDAPLPQRSSLEELRKLDTRRRQRQLKRRKWKQDLGADEAEVDILFRKRGVISSTFGAEVADRDIAKLRPGQWLNDEVINFYGVLVTERSKKCEAAGKTGPGKPFRRTHVFSTFFFAKLQSHQYEGVRRWTKKIDLWQKDIIICPINLGNAHWTCGAINMAQHRFEYYDSMGMKNAKAYELLREYLKAESLDKRKKPIDLSDWQDYFDSGAPQQDNAFDCGVFASQVMETISRNNVGLDFAQRNMPYIRRKMVLECAKQSLIKVHDTRLYTPCSSQRLCRSFSSEAFGI